MTAGFWLHMVLFAVLAAALIWRVGIEPVSWKRAAFGRAAAKLFTAFVLATPSMSWRRLCLVWSAEP